MVSKIDPALLLQNLGAIPERELLFVPENLRYLMDAVVIPLLNEQTVSLSSLDYDQFEETDLDSLEQYVDKVTGKNSDLWLLRTELGRLSPLSIHRPVFC